MGKLFGTDGVRGIVGRDLGCMLAMNIGKATVKLLGEGKYAVARDTRLSSEMLSASLCAGLCSMGGKVSDLGILPTPGLSVYQKKGDFKGAIMISASHNPWEYNGIKIFDGNANKLSEEHEEELEKLLFEAPYWKEYENCGTIRACRDAVKEYSLYLTSLCECDLSSFDIAVDTANGAASTVAPLVFDKLGCRTVYMSDVPNGKNINFECGSTDLRALCRCVKENHLDCGIAFDGDADRCLFVDETGKRVDGDVILALCAKDMKSRGILNNKCIVATVMSDSGLISYCNNAGVRVELADVGDKNVADLMRKTGSNLGGESSGHIIFGEHSTHGDGLLTALKMLSVMKRRRKRLSELAKEVPKYPRAEKNVTVSAAAKDSFYSNRAITEALNKAEKQLGSAGRIVARPSGTEPCIRVMVQGDDISLVENTVNEIEKEIIENLR